ncbi:diguanylate phosphodiesterase [Burkholderia sp. WAC0059]|uniref:EAL and HDOD domain-containing protein n=1 Tax=Burkholderia sp. WAC0059 TaxID=2066022 RepID=UPI000C7F5574|nr:EAL domain-containing protein [Burkholderia sp. WAC0059]PLZ04504.1 diguanylate phosphodiesterase [Burkholderia sp. WAC0059]
MLCGFELKARIVRIESPDAPRDAPGAVSDESDGAPGDGANPHAGEIRAFVGALASPGLRAALAGHDAQIDVPAWLLFDDGMRHLPPGRFTFELSPALGADPALIERLVKLHGYRYRFVLDDVAQIDDAFAKLLPYVEAVKIDFSRIPRVMLPKLAEVLKAAGKILIADHVANAADFSLAHEFGFDRFQGYFFALPQGSTRHASAPRHALLDMLQLLASEPTVAQLEAGLMLNPVLVMHLMRLANSGRFDLGRKVTTLREAINATGTDRIARWTQLLLYADGRKVPLEDDPLLQLAATRARFIELAMERLPDAGLGEVEAAFLVGVFSLIDTVFGGAIGGTLDRLALSPMIRKAIVQREGRLGQLLDAVQALECANWARIDEVCERLESLGAADVSALGLEAAEWAGMADRNTDASELERIED